MDSPVLASTFLLTLLLLVGLFFFIKASVKDRTESAQFLVDQAESTITEELNQYFQHRAYTVDTSASADNSATTLTGFVRPSLFLAIFLSLLAAIGFFCLALVISLLLPPNSQWIFAFPLLLAPAAGLFYWKGAARTEQIQFRVQPAQADTELQSSKSLVTVVAHRDELIALQQTLPLQKKEA